MAASARWRLIIGGAVVAQRGSSASLVAAASLSASARLVGGAARKLAALW